MSWLDRLRNLLGRARDEGPGRAAGTDPRGYSCEEALERLFEWLDGELAGEEESKVQEHFDVCARCYPVLAHERAFREAMERVRNGTAPPPELRERILEALEANGFRPS